MQLPRRLLTIFILLSLISCSKGGNPAGTDTNDPDPHVHNPLDTQAPVITIQSPPGGQVMTAGTPIQVSGIVSDDLGLYRGTIRVIRDINGVEEKKQSFEIHGLRSYGFSLSSTPAVNAPTDFTIVVFFEDHGYNGTTQSVKVKINP